MEWYEWPGWTPLREWVVAVGGVVAVVIGLSTYVRSVRDRRREQAKLVYASIDQRSYSPGEFVDLPSGGQMSAYQSAVDHRVDGQRLLISMRKGAAGVAATATIHNLSRELIGPIRVVFTPTDNAVGHLHEQSAYVPSLAPESSMPVTYIWQNPLPRYHMPIRARITFRDAAGSWWQRSEVSPVEWIHDDPRNMRATAAERAVEEVDAKAEGRDVRQGYIDSRVGPMVGTFRLWRRLRGRPPLD